VKGGTGKMRIHVIESKEETEQRGIQEVESESRDREKKDTGSREWKEWHGKWGYRNQRVKRGTGKRRIQEAESEKRDREKKDTGSREWKEWHGKWGYRKQRV
jgi:hypothetical protein